MLTKLKQWLSRWGSAEAYDVYAPNQRCIYSYWNGRELLRVDPMILYKKLMEVGPELDVDIKVANSSSRDANKAYENMLAKIRQVFSVQPFDQGGLTEEETVALLDHYMAFNTASKKNWKPFAISSNSSVASGPPSDGPPITTSSTDCSSARNGCSTPVVPTSPMASPSPSV